MAEDQTPQTPRKKTKKLYILALDIGTSSVKCYVYDKSGDVKGRGSRKMEMIHPHPGWCEIEPDHLYKLIIECMTEALSDADTNARNIIGLGITTLRNTFITWDRETGNTFHNFVSWQDLRASDYVEKWNKSYSLKALNGGSKFVHAFTRQNRYLAASVLKFMDGQVTLRLLWQLDNVENLRRKACENQVMFGCIETWLLWKLTGGKVHATDYSCASATGMFDPFQVCWSSIVCNLVNIPLSMLPEVRDTSGFFGEVDSCVFGHPIPILSVAADQQAAMFGQCCFKVGDMKCTLGTGLFMNLNTGEKPHASVAGLYPLIGWKIGSKITYIAEGYCGDCGMSVDWGKSIGLYENSEDTSDIAESVSDSGGVYMVSAFSGLQAPINDSKAATTIIGLTQDTTKAHLTRALLEAIAFRVKILYSTFLTETKIPLSYIRADGGVSCNNFLMQLASDLTSQTIDRSSNIEMTSLGAAFLAGLAAGVWKSEDELKALRKSNQLFSPQPTWTKYKKAFHQWERVVNRSSQWYIDT